MLYEIVSPGAMPNIACSVILIVELDLTFYFNANDSL